MADDDGFHPVGTGTNVFEQDEPAEGVARWLDSPSDVIALVSSGELANTIAISRGGTTTFMAPALSGGVGGLITLQGSPESHLGILSREFGIPCVMSVKFTEGIETSRGETVPADGTRLRLDVSGSPDGVVLARDDG